MNTVKYFTEMAREVELGYVQLDFFIRRLAVAYEAECKPDTRYELERLAIKTVGENS